MKPGTADSEVNCIYKGQAQSDLQHELNHIYDQIAHLANLALFSGANHTDPGEQLVYRMIHQYHIELDMILRSMAKSLEMIANSRE